MSQGFQIHHPMLFVISILILFSVIQSFLMWRRKRGLSVPEWPKSIFILLLAALCFVGVFGVFK
jgi:hypothetical protein